MESGNDREPTPDDVYRACAEWDSKSRISNRQPFSARTFSTSPSRVSKKDRGRPGRFLAKIPRDDRAHVEGGTKKNPRRVPRPPGEKETPGAAGLGRGVSPAIHRNYRGVGAWRFEKIPALRNDGHALLSDVADQDVSIVANLFFHSFPRSPWECRLGRSASAFLAGAGLSAGARRRRASRTAFPRGAWERV
jgi:hypothetical protein